MIISKRLGDAEFIMSKDELTYSAVIEDFKNASQIHILTYNISKDQKHTLHSNSFYQMHGSQISVKTLDLNLPFAEIAAQMDRIAELHFTGIAKIIRREARL